jgi:metal-dependent HD superfamily phosphatase/phosphodiesterase
MDIKTKNAKLAKVVKKVFSNKRIKTYWTCANINAIDRMGVNDHGYKHAEIVSEYALKILKLLKDKKIETSLVKDYALNKHIKKYDLNYNDSEVVVFLASCLHDIGTSIHKENHGHYSMAIVDSLLEDILKGVYPEEERVIIKSEVLHAIMSHRGDPRALTLEAGVVGLADALDMKTGRAKIVFRTNRMDSVMHKVSALSIKNISITSSEETPVIVDIAMSDPSGIFQIEQGIKRKIENTPIAKYVKVIGHLDKSSKDPDYFSSLSLDF